MNKKNKKADFTLEETMKIILAVVSIGLLLYLAASFYGIFTVTYTINITDFDDRSRIFNIFSSFGCY